MVFVLIFLLEQIGETMKKLKLIALFLCSLFLLITFTACNNFRDRYFDDPQNIVASFKENEVLYDNLIHTILSSSKIQNHLKNAYDNINSYDSLADFSYRDSLEVYSYYDRNDEHFFVDRVVTAEEWKTIKNLAEQLHVDSISINPDGWITLLFPLKNHSESSICLLEYYYDKTVGSQFGETLYEERKRIFTNNYTSYDLGPDWLCYVRW